MKRPLFVGASVSISVRILLGISLWFVMLTTQTQAQYGPLTGIKLLPENIHFVGNRAMTSDDLRAIFRSAGTVTAKISAAQMDIYDTNRINLAIEMIQMFYRNRGFVKLTIELPEFSFLSGAARRESLTLPREKWSSSSRSVRKTSTTSDKLRWKVSRLFLRIRSLPC